MSEADDLDSPRGPAPLDDASREVDGGPRFDPRELRDVMGSFATGVVAVTYESDGVTYGLTANSFTSVSLDPALVLVSVMRTSRALEFLLDRPFAVNVLADHQRDVALHFAGRRLEQEPSWLRDGGAPRLHGAVATLQCELWRTYEAGDHVLVLGRVVAFDDQRDSRPLIFERGRWGALAVHPQDERSPS